MSELDRMLAAVRRLLKAGDVLSRTFANELADVLRDAERLMVPIALDATASDATQIALRNALFDAGYAQLIDSATGARLERLAGLVDATVLSEADVTAAVGIDALQVAFRLDLADSGKGIAQTVWRAVMRNVLIKADRKVLLEDLGKALDISAAQTQTLYDTNVSVFQRMVTARQSSDGAEATFLYLGPVDGKMRPFCRGLVGQVLTHEAIDQLDNGQMANVFLTGGGYNCRHVWTPVFGMAANTGERVPEVQQALRFVTKVKRAA